VQTALTSNYLVNLRAEMTGNAMCDLSASLGIVHPSSTSAGHVLDLSGILPSCGDIELNLKRVEKEDLDNSIRVFAKTFFDTLMQKFWRMMAEEMLKVHA